jgi:hypothetical protein
MDPNYRFPGMADFVRAEGIPPNFAAKIPGNFFVARAVDALSQIPQAHEDARESMLETARQARDAAQAVVDTIDAAIADVEAKCFGRVGEDEGEDEGKDKDKDKPTPKSAADRTPPPHAAPQPKKEPH